MPSQKQRCQESRDCGLGTLAALGLTFENLRLGHEHLNEVYAIKIPSTHIQDQKTQAEEEFGKYPASFPNRPGLNLCYPTFCKVGAGLKDQRL